MTVKNTESKNTCYGYDERNYCAIDENFKESNICYGDSGGGLMYLMNGGWYLYGVSSFILADRYTNKCLTNYPSFYTMVPKYIDWINKILNFNQTKILNFPNIT